MSSSAARDTVVKKKHVRFASMEDDDDNDEQEEDTLFDKRKDTRRGMKSALKVAKMTAKGGRDERVEVVGGGRSGHGACGRWMVTLALCASFLGLVNFGASATLMVVQLKYTTKMRLSLPLAYPLTRIYKAVSTSDNNRLTS